MQIVIDIATDADAKRVTDAFTTSFGYRERIPDPLWSPDPEKREDGPPFVANPMSAEEFVTDRVKAFVADVVKGHEVGEASRKAAAKAHGKDLPL